MSESLAIIVFEGTAVLATLALVITVLYLRAYGTPAPVRRLLGKRPARKHQCRQTS